MKFAFTYPAKIVFAERNVEMVHHHYDGLDFYTGPINKNVYFCSKTGKIKIKDYSVGTVFQVYLKIEDCLAYCACVEPDRISEWFGRNIEFVKENIGKWSNSILHPEIYEQEQATKRAEFKAHRDAQDKEEHERKQARAKAAQEAYDAQIKAFTGDGWITWETFERACKENNISMPIKTIGFGRKNVVEIRKGQVRRYGKHTSPVIFDAANKLHEKLNVSCVEGNS